MNSKVLFAILLLTGLLSSACTTEKEAGQPNFVWIISEDNSTHYMELFDAHGIITVAIKGLRLHLGFEKPDQRPAHTNPASQR